jgi:hypothetical protein
MDIRVVFPAPFGPNNPKVSLLETFKLKLLTAEKSFLYPRLIYNFLRLLMMSGAEGSIYNVLLIF